MTSHGEGYIALAIHLQNHIQQHFFGAINNDIICDPVNTHLTLSTVLSSLLYGCHSESMCSFLHL